MNNHLEYIDGMDPIHLERGLARVSVYEINAPTPARPNYKVYTVAWSEAGNRKRVSRTSKNEALTFAKRKLAELIKEGGSAVTTVRVADWQNVQTQIRRLGGTSLATAIGYFLAHHEVTSPKLIFTPHEAEALMSTVRTDGIPYLALQLFAGLRPNEVAKLEWSDIDLRGNTISIRHKWPREVPILPKLHRILVEFKKNNTVSGLVVRIAQPQKVFIKQTIRRAAAKLNDPKFKAPRQMGARYSFICYHRALTGKPEETARIAGIGNESDHLPEVSHADAVKYFN